MKRYETILLISIAAILTGAALIIWHYYPRSSAEYGSFMNEEPAAASPTPPASNPAVGSSIAWGAYAGDQIGAAADFEAQVGKKMDLEAVFIDMEEGSFPSQFVSGTKGYKTLIIFWEPNNIGLEEIASGTLDAYLKEFASSAKYYGQPVILLPFAEMNGNWEPWAGNSPAKIIAAWRHIHALFADAPNVAFGWAVNHESVPDTPENQIEEYWPGDSYVDYVGVDGFNFGNPWQSFEEIFDNALARLKVYNKPVYVFSFACTAGPAKAGWIADALTIQIPKHSEIAGWVWFNVSKENDWRVWSDQNSLTAFKASLP